MPHNPTDSQRRQSPPADRRYERSCPNCGAAFISEDGRCACGGFAKAGDEMTRKTFGEPDLKKGLR